MSDSAQFPNAESAFEDETQPHHAKHRLEGVPVDAQPLDTPPLLAEFGENPDTSSAG